MRGLMLLLLFMHQNRAKHANIANPLNYFASIYDL